jgi:ABC-type multidrug transport system ATPase subunit
VTAGPSIVALREVSKSYPSGTIALDRLSLDVGAGELLSLLGRPVAARARSCD